MTRVWAVLISIIAGMLVGLLLFPVMGDSRGSLSVVGNRVPSSNSLVAVLAATVTAAIVWIALHQLAARRRR